MSVERFVGGAVLLLITLTPVYLGARAWRQRIVPAASGPLSALIEVVFSFSTVVVVCEVLGSIGLYRLPAMPLGLVVAGSVGWITARRSTAVAAVASAPPRAVVPELGRQSLFVSVVAVAVLVGSWATHVVYELHRGIYSIDSLWYHLPVAARFVQEGSITGVHYVDGDALTAFYPDTTPLLHGLGMMFLGSDVITPVFNLGLLAFVLTAAWSIGRPSGVAPVTLVAAAAVFATPILVSTLAGGAYNDLFGVGMLLVAGAVLVEAGTAGRPVSRPELVVAGLAAGLALGTKWQFITPVAILTIGVIVLLPRRQRLRRFGPYLAGLLITGSYWYVHNVIVTGSPVPAFELSFGPFSLPHTPHRLPEDAITEYLFDERAWRDYFIPGINDAFGPMWWALFALVTMGIALGIVSPRNGAHRLFSIVGGLALVAYVVTPIALSVGPVPFFFVYTLRYAVTGLVFGAVALPLSPALRGARALWVLWAFALVIIVTQIDPSIWPTEIRDGRFSEPVRGVDSAAAALIGLLVLGAGLALVGLRKRNPSWRPPLAAFAVVLVAALGLGAAVQQRYLDGRYTHVDIGALTRAYRWAQGVHDERIAVAGNWLEYPFYGKDLSNHVQYVGIRGPDHTYSEAPNCREWRTALNSGRYTYVVTTPTPIGTAIPQQSWTEDDPAARRVLQDDLVSVFRVEGQFDPQTCE